MFLFSPISTFAILRSPCMSGRKMRTYLVRVGFREKNLADVGGGAFAGAHKNGRNYLFRKNLAGEKEGVGCCIAFWAGEIRLLNGRLCRKNQLSHMSWKLGVRGGLRIDPIWFLGL